MTKRAFDTSRRWAAQPIPMSCDPLFVCPETRHCTCHPGQRLFLSVTTPFESAGALIRHCCGCTNERRHAHNAEERLRVHHRGTGRRTRGVRPLDRFVPRPQACGILFLTDEENLVTGNGTESVISSSCPAASIKRARWSDRFDRPKVISTVLAPDPDIEPPFGTPAAR